MNIEIVIETSISSLFTVHPEYIARFTRLQGLNLSNVMDSEGMVHYARTLIEKLVNMIKAGADDVQLKTLTDISGKAHQPRNVTKAEFGVSFNYSSHSNQIDLFY